MNDFVVWKELMPCVSVLKRDFCPLLECFSYFFLFFLCVLLYYNSVSNNDVQYNTI